jgi:hypothetical protein
MTFQEITLNPENCDMKFIPQDGGIANQIIVKLYRGDECFSWNFCPDKEVDVMGTCGNSDVFMQIAGCEMHKWYRRFAYTDPEPQIIIEEMSQQEINNYINELEARRSQHSPNNSANNPQNGCRTSTFHNSATNDIVMTFE